MKDPITNRFKLIRVYRIIALGEGNQIRQVWQECSSTKIMM